MAPHKPTQVVCIWNSRSPEFIKAKQYLEPYLEHLGIPFDSIDIASADLPSTFHSYHLIILSHSRLASPGSEPHKRLFEAVCVAARTGTGLISFDGDFFSRSHDTRRYETLVGDLTFRNNHHYITQNHSSGERLRLFGVLPLCEFVSGAGDILLEANGKPFLWVSTFVNSRVGHWASLDWLNTAILGPLGGLDDCLWRSIVWAAKKPFVLRGLPPLVTMRVDDVAGTGETWGKSPLYWVAAANRFGLKPWLGLFIYNLTPRAIDELRSYIADGQATASPHAFGRPPRGPTKHRGFKRYLARIRGRDTSPVLYYNPASLAPRSAWYDEFIFFDHQNQKPWSDGEAGKGLEAVDAWYEANAPMPMSEFLVPHWYEIGSNVAEHIRHRWGVQFIAKLAPADSPLTDSVAWAKEGPFRRFEIPGTVTQNDAATLRGNRPVYYADFTKMGESEFFNCLTEIRDVSGYEWAPDNDIAGTVDRGVRQLERALGGMALAALFTHETDYIYAVSPETWQKSLQLITEAIAHYNPLYLTMDDALKVVRSTKTTRLSHVRVDRSHGVLTTGFVGTSDVTSYFYAFFEEGGQIQQKLIPVPEFSGSLEVEIGISDGCEERLAT